MRRIIAWLTATAVLTAALTVFQINFAEHEFKGSHGATEHVEVDVPR